MTMSDEAPTLAERYSRATTSSHLKLEEGRCDVDMLIAAGWLRDGLGALLYRLRGEFDAAKAAMRHADAQLPSWESRALEAESALRAWHPPMKHPRAEPAQIRTEGAAYARTEHALALISLKTLRPAAVALQNFALAVNTEKWALDQRAAQQIAGRALDVWLDPLCPACDGRGFSGASHRGERETTCGGCRGTGKRSALLGESAVEKRFAWMLLDEIAAHLEAVNLAMRRALRQTA